MTAKFGFIAPFQFEMILLSTVNFSKNLEEICQKAKQNRPTKKAITIIS